MADTISLGFNIALLVFVFFGVFWGLIRGLKKTVGRGLFLLVTSIILLFISMSLTRSLLNIKISANIVVEGTVNQTSVTIIEYLAYEIEDMIGKNVAESFQSFINVIISLPILLINSFIYVLLFWLLKLLLLPINALINMLIFRRKKKEPETLGFASGNEEYNQSDKSIESLRDVYNKTQIEKNNSGMFIKNDEAIGKDAPTAQAERVRIDPHQAPEEPAPQENVKQKQKEERKTLKQSKKEEHKNSAPKKRRLLGGLVGAFVGIIVMFHTMLPIYGFIDIIRSNKSFELKHLADQEVSLSTLTDGIADEVVKGYELSVLGRMSKVIGLEALGVAGFDKLTTSKVGDNKVSLRGDISAIVTTLKEVDNFVGLYKNATSNETMNQEDLSALIVGIENVLNKTQEVQLVCALGDLFIPITIDLLIANDAKIVDNENANKLIINTLTEIAEDSELKIFNELKAILDIAKYLDSQKLLIKLVNNDYSNMLTTINNLDDDFGTVLTTKIFNLRSVSTVFPSILEIGLTFLDESTEFEYTKNSATAEELKNSISVLLDNTLETAKTLSEESGIYLTDESLPPLGKVLDTFKNSKLLNTETYNSLVNYAINNIKQMTSEIIPENFKDFFNNKLLKNISQVESWESEMTIISNTLQVLRDKNHGILGKYDPIKDKRIGYDFSINISKETFINIGKALDTLESSVLIGSDTTITHNSNNYETSSLVSLVNSLLNTLQDSIKDTDNTLLHDITNVIDSMQTNLITAEHISTQDSTFWQDEMTAIAPLVIYINDLSEAEDFEITDELGEILDGCAYNSVMLGKNTTLKLMSTLVSTVKDEVLGEDYTFADDESFEDSIYTLLNDIETRLNSDELYTIMKNDKEQDFWTTEINCILALNNISDTAGNITDIDGALEIAEDLDSIYASNIIPLNSFNSTIATVLRQLKSDSTTGVEAEINNMIEEIATDITSENFFDNKTKENFWQIELEHISTLRNLQLSDEEGYSVKDNLSTIGSTLDSITRGKKYTINEDTITSTNTSSRASYLITENRVRKLLSTSIQEVSESITSAFEEGDLQESIVSSLESICTNIYDNSNSTQIEISSFEYELSHLETLSNLDINSDLFKYTNNVEALNTNLKNLGNKLDSISHNTITEPYNLDPNQNVTRYNEVLNSRIITREILANIISAGFGTALVEEGADSDSAVKMYNNLISDIQASIMSTLRHPDPNNDQKEIPDKVIKWGRELSYVSNLTQLNADKVFTLDNAITDVATHLDLISFNTIDGNYADITYAENNDILGLYTDYIEDDTDPDNIIRTYYNSVIISRDILKNGVNNLLETLNVSDSESSDLSDSQKEIVSELINNLKTKINTGTTIQENVLYSTYTEAFNDLNEVKNIMKSKTNIVSNDVDLSTLTNNVVEEIDKTLTDLQSRIISGAVTTRKIALMIAKEVMTSMTNVYASIPSNPYTFEETEAGIFTQSLINYYEDPNNVNSTANEIYYSSTSINNYDYENPFMTIKSTLLDLSTYM